MKHHFPLVLTICLCICNFSSHAQNEILYGLVDNTLVEIDPTNATITTDITAIDIGVDVPIVALEYLPNECNFYGIINASDDPALVRFDWTGQGEVIGEINVPGEEVYFCESLVGLNEDNMLLASVSLNGGIPSGDYSSEALIMIDPSNAMGTLVSELVFNSTTQTDIDDMDLISDELIIHDGRPNNFSSFYNHPYTNLPNPFSPTLFAEHPYTPTQGIACLDGLCYSPINDRRLMRLDLSNGDFSSLGLTHSAAEYNGDYIRAVEFVKPDIPNQMLVDTTACIGETLTLTVAEGVENAIWNNGAFSNSIDVDANGQFFYQGFDGNCPILSDIFNVTFVECVPCEDIFMMVADQLNLGNDTILCNNETLTLNIDLDDSFDILWSDGTTGNQTTITSAGIYSATISNMDCEFQTTNISVVYQIFTNPVVQEFSICEGDIVTLDVIPEVINPIWNTGATTNSITVTELGPYFYEGILNACSFQSDTFLLSLATDCNPCDEIFEMIEDPLTLGNDLSLCTGDSLVLNLGLDDNFVMEWSNGVVGNEIVIAETGTYSAIVTTDDCEFSTSEINVNFEFCDPCAPLLSIIQDDLFIGNDTVLCSEDQLTLEIDIQTELDYDVFWNNNSTENPLIINLPGIYQASVIIDGCTFQSNSVSVFFNECEDCQYYIPNSFSPNDDGFNDEYQIFFDNSNCLLSDFKMQVYNRWGGLIYESDQNRWDGKLNGEFLNSGVYLVCMEFTINQFGETINKRECVAVNLLR